MYKSDALKFQIELLLSDLSVQSYKEGARHALDNAAMTAYDMGRPDIREAINKLVPEGYGR